MFFLRSLLVLTIATVYFYLLGIRFFALIPLLILFGVIAYTLISSPLSLAKRQLSKYSLYIAWLLILGAVFGILSFLGMRFPDPFLRLLVGNMGLRFLSYGIEYHDGKKIFQFGYYITLCIFFGVGLFLIPKAQIASFLIMLLSFQFGCIGFLKFILGSLVKIEDNTIYTLSISGLLLICGLFISRIPSLPGALAIISLILFGIYSALWWFLQRKPVKNTKISVRRILAGERITSKAIFSNTFLTKMYHFVIDMPPLYKYILEGINIIVVVVLLGSFIVNRSQITDIQHLVYWIVIALFVGNVLVLKRMDCTGFLQNLFLFLVIHFAVYISLFSYFESNITSVVFWSVARNILTSLGLFILPHKYQRIFSENDYWYRIITSILSFLVNIFLLLKSGLAGELIFFLFLLYVGIESMLVFYGVKHINKKFGEE